ncbi:MAG TPA: sodium/glutamate symporter [Bryobacteraceae bacterium]|nr:sodium/glutamate symporter [Bryobacteraceae bacterium]
MPTWNLNAIQVLAISCFGAAMGAWLKRKAPLFDRFHVPAPILGGLVFAFLILLLRDRVVNFEMDLVLRDIFMVAFFTSIGLEASARLVRQGGLQVLGFLALATLGVVLQNVLGVGLAMLLGYDPLLGLLCGSISLTGGPATALAFGATFEKMGMQGASAVGVAAAMFGIVAGGLMGGAVGASIIRRHRLVSSGVKSPVPSPQPAPWQEAETTVQTESPPVNEPEAEHPVLFRTLVTLAVAMGLGTLISGAIERTGLVLPAYVGAMIAAGLIRNLDDRFGFIGISPRDVEVVGTMSLYVFIVMALLTLRLWELAHLALPFLGILAAQVLLVWLFARVLVYRMMGRDFDAAVMAGGYCGFGLGTTANAVACMDVLVRKFGAAPRAYLVVPIVGAFLIDFTNALVITVMANFMR